MGRGLGQHRPLAGARAGGRLAAGSGADMAALVEPLGLERGKRPRAPRNQLPPVPHTAPPTRPGRHSGRTGCAGRVHCVGPQAQARCALAQTSGPLGRSGTGGLAYAVLPSSVASALTPSLVASLRGLRAVMLSSLSPPRRVPCRGAPRAAPAQRGAAAAEAASSSAGSAEPLLLRHPRGEPGLRLPAAPEPPTPGPRYSPARGSCGSCSSRGRGGPLVEKGEVVRRPQGLLCLREEGSGGSRTLRHPLQVYEQLYDTLDITGSAEIRAHATAKVGAQAVLCPPL